ncbi:L-2-Hydroxyglutarate Dehydrogenase [Manis pentadactyla]|nr:L-2-Hydroxyglutarate Dehydrogenase [Manis pentadactyla]
MSQWHPARYGWGQRASFPDGPPARGRVEATAPKGGKTISQLDSGFQGPVSLPSKFLWKRQTYWRPLYPWCKQDWLPHLQLEEVPRDYQNCAPKLSLKCPQPQVVGYSQVSGCVDVVADKIPGLEPAKPAKSPSLQRNKEEVSLWCASSSTCATHRQLRRALWAPASRRPARGRHHLGRCRMHSKRSRGAVGVAA